MTKSEINQEIWKLERNIADAKGRKTEAEKNIRQLNALNVSCYDYQTDFEASRTTRKIKMNHFNQIMGQSKLVGIYGDLLEDELDGTDYIDTYGCLDVVKGYINQEIQIQERIVAECTREIAGYNIDIGYLNR